MEEDKSKKRGKKSSKNIAPPVHEEKEIVFNTAPIEKGETVAEIFGAAVNKIPEEKVINKSARHNWGASNRK